MTVLISNKKEQESASPLHIKAGEAEILHLKRLLVTLKQQYEKNLKDFQQQLALEQTQKQALKEDLNQAYEQLQEQKLLHEEELQALREQQLTLRDLFKKAQDDKKERDSHLAESGEQMVRLMREKAALESRLQESCIVLEESESRLKIAQQHLAKKVKETTLLTEKVEEQQANLDERTQTIENYKVQLAHLLANEDLHHAQEKKLHEALKGLESQAAKWEEKYFRMYDKWQESESRIQELKKFEEKHYQMQNLLVNLGHFMDTPPNVNSLTSGGRLPVFEMHQEDPAPSITTQEPEEKYDLFGMRHIR